MMMTGRGIARPVILRTGTCLADSVLLSPGVRYFDAMCYTKKCVENRKTLHNGKRKKQ